MSFASLLRAWHDDPRAGAPDIEGLVAAAFDDPPGVAAAIDEITVSVRDHPDLAFIRLLGVVEVLNEVLRRRKALPAGFAEAVGKLREALEWIATALNATSYQLGYSAASGGVTVAVTFASDA